MVPTVSVIERFQCFNISNIMQDKKIIAILTLHNFLVKVISRFVKIHHEKSMNANFLR